MSRYAQGTHAKPFEEPGQCVLEVDNVRALRGRRRVRVLQADPTVWISKALLDDCDPRVATVTDESFTIHGIDGDVTYRLCGPALLPYGHDLIVGELADHPDYRSEWAPTSPGGQQ